MIKLIKENELKKDKNFLLPSQIKDLCIDESVLMENAMIKGRRMSGKTDKILLPSFSKCKNGVLFVDCNGESLSKVIELAKKNQKTVHIFYNRNVNINKMIKFLKRDHVIYFNVRQGKEVDLEYLNKILEGLYKNKERIETSLNIFIDNIQFFKKLSYFPELIMMDSNIKFMVTLGYTRQLTDYYGQEVVDLLKEKMSGYDIEKLYEE